MQEQLVRLAQREREAAAITGQDELLPTLIIEKGKTREEQEKAKILVSLKNIYVGPSAKVKAAT